MFGIVKDKHPLINNSVVGIRNVYLQNSSIRSPIKLVAKTAPSRPDIKDRQSAIALKNLSEFLKELQSKFFKFFARTFVLETKKLQGWDVKEVL